MVEIKRKKTARVSICWTGVSMTYQLLNFNNDNKKYKISNSLSCSSINNQRSPHIETSQLI